MRKIHQNWILCNINGVSIPVIHVVMAMLLGVVDKRGAGFMQLAVDMLLKISGKTCAGVGKFGCKVQASHDKSQHNGQTGT